jgi:hypothetical protein
MRSLYNITSELRNLKEQKAKRKEKESDMSEQAQAV